MSKRLKLSKEIEIAKLQIENLTSNRQRRNVFDKTSKLNDQNDIDETQVAYRDRHFISHEGKDHLTCFPCHICTQVFQTKFDVNSHIASVHEEDLNKILSNDKLGSLPYNCDICHAYGYAVNNMIIIKHRKDCEEQNVT